MQHMNLDDAPLGAAAPDSPVPGRTRASSRTSSTGTAFRVSSGNMPTARRVSAKQPLGVDLTFGNSPSTVQRFKRIPSADRRQALRSNPPANQNDSHHSNPSATSFRPSPPSADLMFEVSDVNNENAPPEAEYPPMPVTKDALYGRRAYSKVLDGVFQEAYADTGSSHQREAMGRVASAWQQLDEIDPQGEFMLLKAMVDRLKGDSKLAAALGIEMTSRPQSPLRRQGSDTSYGGTTVHGNGTTRVRSNSSRMLASKLSSSSISKSSTSEDYDSPSTPVDTPAGTPTNTSGTPVKGPGGKLILAQNNPHLKSHRRRQSAFAVGERPYSTDSLPLVDERKLPGHVEKGMEQQGLLADILYGQWMSGLRSRWPGASSSSPAVTPRLT
jgi:serine/threonine-protein kinase 24/25/MST4